MSAAGQKFGYTLKADGLPARVALALLMSAGIVYASTGPVIVTGLALSEMFSSESAGYVSVSYTHLTLPTNPYV